jgi:soluble lytic murein transglycosylase-like protein
MTTSANLVEPRSTWIKRIMMRGGLLLVGGIMLSALSGWSHRPAPAPSAAAVLPSATALDHQLASVRGEIAVVKSQLDRAQAVMKYSTKYQIPADLSAAIYDIALSEGIDPPLAYQLVKVESNFKSDARSSAGALGYTQIQLATARYFAPRVTEHQLLRRDVNLRMGLRFLKTLMVQYHGDMHLALLAYNRGPARVNQILASGGDPANGYAMAVLQDYHPQQSVEQ